MRKILILGAGIYQVPLIKKAKELGCYTIVCSIKGNYPGFKYADKVYYVDTTNKENCLKIAINEGVIAVCTTGTDVALPTLGYIVDKMHLKGPSEQSAIMSSNKLFMQEAFHKNHVNSATYFKVKSLDECREKACLIGFPCILKVVDSSGSRGIKIVMDQTEIAEAYETILPYTRLDYIIVEEFLKGEEFGAQAFVYEGEVLFVMPHSDDIYQGDTGVPIGHHVPFKHQNNQSITHSIYDETEKAIKALCIDNAAVNVDMILVGEKPYVLEIGARCGGTCLPELVSLHYNIDYYKMILEAAMGTLNANDYAFIPTQAVSGMLITSPATGTIKDYNINIEDEGIYDLSMDYPKGALVGKFQTGPDRIGQLIVYGNTAEEVREKSYAFLSKVNLQIAEMTI